MQELTNLFLTYMLISFSTATLGVCFYEFTKPNMIFNFYGIWLYNLSQKNKFWDYVSKPLGLCPYCNTTWIALMVFYYYFGLSLPIFLFIGLTWFFVHLILKIK
jgi:hypothetical protein